jgi:hypothetical protein
MMVSPLLLNYGNAMADVAVQSNGFTLGVYVFAVVAPKAAGKIALFANRM